MIGKTEGINHYTVEHAQYGRGGAILVKYRLKPADDLFMCSFSTLKGKTFYCRKHFDRAGEIWFVDEKEPVRKRKRSQTEQLEEQLKGFFFSGATNQ